MEFKFCLDVLAGDRAALKQVTAGLVGLKFSRAHESEADARSVKYFVQLTTMQQVELVSSRKLKIWVDHELLNL